MYYLESHLTQANPTPELLGYLGTYDFANYIQKLSQQYHAVDIIVLMDTIMRWLQKVFLCGQSQIIAYHLKNPQVNDHQLRTKVTADFDKWFSSSLGQYSRVVQIQHFLASIAIDGSLLRWKSLRKVVLKNDRAYSIQQEVDEEEFCMNYGLDSETEETGSAPFSLFF